MGYVHGALHGVVHGGGERVAWRREKETMTEEEKEREREREREREGEEGGPAQSHRVQTGPRLYRRREPARGVG